MMKRSMKQIGVSLVLGGVAVAVVVLLLSGVADPSAAAPLRAPAGSCGEVSCTYYLPLVAVPSLPPQFEVTQGVQQPDNSVMLVAGRPTYVRLTLTSTTAYAGVSAWLYGSRGGVDLPGSPIAALNNPRTLQPTVNRAVLNDTFNFALPASWASGSISLWATASNGAGYSYVSSAAQFQFAATDPMNVTVIPIAYTCTNGGGTRTPAPPYDYLVDYTFRTYPVPYIITAVGANLSYSGPCTGGVPDPDYGDWVNLLNGITNRWVAAGQPDNYYYGLLDVYCDYGCISGLGWVGGYKAAVGFSGFGPTHEGASETHAHEVGHNHGREHSPGCGADDPDPAYPYVSGGKALIGNAAHPNYGFDIDSRAIYPYSSYYDIMSYCSPEWVSDWTYQALWAYDATYRASLSEPLGERSLLIAGQIGAEGVVFRPAYLLEAPAYPPQAGDYTVELLDGRGRVIAAYPFDPLTAVVDLYPPAPGPEYRAFVLSLPPAEGVEAVRVRQDDAVLGLLQPGSRPPVLKAESVRLQGDVLHWQASDADGDALHYAVRVSADGGATWELVAIDLATPSLALEAERWEGADLLIEVIASDGLHTTTLRTGGSW